MSGILRCIRKLIIDIDAGFLGDLTLSIPWNDLKNKPVRVFINNVYLLAAPKTETEYDPELEAERAHKLKMDKIEAAKLLSTKDKIPGI
jgi:vacuolar protein sorting-associated protein 13A/C